MFGGQCPLPLLFHHFVKVHGGSGVLHRRVAPLSSLDVSVEDGLGEPLQRGALVLGETSLLVEQRDSRRVSGQGAGVSVTEDLEVIVDSVANHHLPHEQPQYLLPGLREWHGVDKVTAPDAAPSRAVVSDRHGGVDEFIVNHVPIIGHHAAACQPADAPLRSCAHHLTVNGEVLGGVSC